MRLGLAGALPPAPTGPADYLAGLLGELAGRADVTCFVSDPSAVADGIRARFDVRPLHERTSGVDLVFYHLANNDVQLPYDFAAREGPPGVGVLHDGSLHHIVSEMLLEEGDEAAYADLLTHAHGETGAALAGVRARGERGDVEPFVFDLVRCFLDAQLGAVVHSDHARRLVAQRVPGLPSWVIPHYAIGGDAKLPRSELGLPDDRLCVGHLGFLTQAKRPDVLLHAFAELRRRGVDAFCVFAGGDYTSGHINEDIAELGLTDDVLVTGFVEDGVLDAYAAALDVVVSLRWPHIGETSGSLMRALRAGTPVVVQGLGTWAELPPDAVYRISGGTETPRNLAIALRELALDEPLRARIGRAGRAYASAVGGPAEAAERYVEVAHAVLAAPRRTPDDVLRERTRAVAGATGAPAWLKRVPPAHLGARLLDVGSPHATRELLAGAWGYDVVGCEHATARLPCETGSVDVVTCSAPLTVVAPSPSGSEQPQTLGVLREANRVLRPDGLAVVAITGRLNGERADHAVTTSLRANGFSEPDVVSFAPRSVVAVARKVSLPAPQRQERQTEQ